MPNLSYESSAQELGSVSAAGSNERSLKRILRDASSRLYNRLGLDVLRARPQNTAQNDANCCHDLQMKADDPRCRTPLQVLIRWGPAEPSSTVIHIVCVRETWLSGLLPSPKFIFGADHTFSGNGPRASRVLYAHLSPLGV